jgi:hypothetical protein
MERQVNARAINRMIEAQRTVVASYELGGEVKQGRIIRARTVRGVLQGKVLGVGRWAKLLMVYV